MGSTSDKIKGVANEAAGNIRQGVGKATDDHEMHDKGVLQERKGEAQQDRGEAKEQLKRTIDRI